MTMLSLLAVLVSASSIACSGGDFGVGDPDPAEVDPGDGGSETDGLAVVRDTGSDLGITEDGDPGHPDGDAVVPDGDALPVLDATPLPDTISPPLDATDTKPPEPSVWSESFTTGVVAVSQCKSFDAWRGALSASRVYGKVTIKGSLDVVGASCSGAAADTLCQWIRVGTVAASIVCDGRTWRVGTCGGYVEITADHAGFCECSAGHTVRPCMSTANWGGVGSTACAAPSQTMTMVCE